MLRFLHVAREPLLKTMSHETRTKFRARNGQCDRTGKNFLENILETDPLRIATGSILHIQRRKADLIRSIIR